VPGFEQGLAVLCCPGVGGVLGGAPGRRGRECAGRSGVSTREGDAQAPGDVAGEHADHHAAAATAADVMADASRRTLNVAEIPLGTAAVDWTASWPCWARETASGALALGRASLETAAVITRTVDQPRGPLHY
jgi:hypothetical protein